MIAQGPDQIAAAFANFFSITGGNLSVSVVSSTTSGAYTLVQYVMSAAHLSVPSGVDTFVIRHGRIVAQTSVLGGLTFR